MMHVLCQVYIFGKIILGGDDMDGYVDIKVRNVPVSELMIFDRKAKERGLDRSKFLRQIIRQVGTEDEWFQERDRYINLLQKMGTVIENNTAELRRLNRGDRQ